MSQCKHVTASSTSSICWEGNWRSVQAQSWLRRRLPLRCLQQRRSFSRRSRPQKFMLRTKTTVALSASARTVTRTPATVICVPSRCSENQGSPSENHRVCLLRSPSLEAADAAVPSQWPLKAPVEQRLIYQASGASRVVLRHEEEYLVPLLPRRRRGKSPAARALLAPPSGARPGPSACVGAQATSHLPPPSPDSPHASNRPTAPRSGGPQPLGRSGELGTMPPGAPVASTPPRRREPGR